MTRRIAEPGLPTADLKVRDGRIELATTPASDAANEARRPPVDANEVVEFLQQHPDFFQEHPQLLMDLHLPHVRGTAVSLVERQVEVLRARNIDLRRRLTDLVANARVNERLFERSRALILEALQLHDVASLIEAAKRHLREEFGVDDVSAILIGERWATVTDARVVSTDTAAKMIGHLLHSDQAVVGLIRLEEADFLFPNSSPKARSAAIVPLHDQGLLGVLAIGSADAQRFTGDMGTLFVRFLGEVLSRLLARTQH